MLFSHSLTLSLSIALSQSFFTGAVRAFCLSLIHSCRKSMFEICTITVSLQCSFASSDSYTFYSCFFASILSRILWCGGLFGEREERACMHTHGRICVIMCDYVCRCIYDMYVHVIHISECDIGYGRKVYACSVRSITLKHLAKSMSHISTCIE